MFQAHVFNAGHPTPSLVGQIISRIIRNREINYIIIIRGDYWGVMYGTSDADWPTTLVVKNNLKNVRTVFTNDIGLVLSRNVKHRTYYVTLNKKLIPIVNILTVFFFKHSFILGIYSPFIFSSKWHKYACVEHNTLYWSLKYLINHSDVYGLFGKKAWVVTSRLPILSILRT